MHQFTSLRKCIFCINTVKKVCMYHIKMLKVGVRFEAIIFLTTYYIFVFTNKINFFVSNNVMLSIVIATMPNPKLGDF